MKENKAELRRIYQEYHTVRHKGNVTTFYDTHWGVVRVPLPKQRPRRKLARGTIVTLL